MLDSIVMTQSKSVFLGLLVAATYVFLSIPSKHRKKMFIFLMLGVILFFSLVDIKFLDRMNLIKHDVEALKKNQVVSVNDELTRLDFWRASILILKDHPLGIGVKNFERIVPLYDPRNKGMDAHNTYVLCYTETGLFGFTLFIIIIIEAFAQLRRIRKRVVGHDYQEQVELQAVTLTTILLIYLFGYMVAHSNLYAELLWILLALPIALDKASAKLAPQSHPLEYVGG